MLKKYTLKELPRVFFRSSYIISPSDRRSIKHTRWSLPLIILETGSVKTSTEEASKSSQLAATTHRNHRPGENTVSEGWHDSLLRVNDLARNLFISTPWWSSFKGRLPYEGSTNIWRQIKRQRVGLKSTKIAQNNTNKERSNTVGGWKWEIPFIKALTAPIGLSSQERYNIW